MSSTGFLVTQAGLAAATVANPGGPYIHITEFRCGSGVNYTPPGYVPGVSPTTQTALQGTTLYTSTAASYTVIDADTVELLLLIPASVSSFNFGEVGIYLEDGTLFAICVFDLLQSHIHAVGNQAGTNWKIRARLKLAQIPAICNVTTLVSQSLLEVPNWQSLIRPVDQPGGANAAIVHDNNSSDDPVLVIRDVDNEWGLVGYSRQLLGSTADGGASATTTTLTHPGIAGLVFQMPSTSSRYMVKFAGGAMRKITGNPSANTVSWTPALGAVPSGAFSIWEEDGKGQRVVWADTVEYNALVADFNPYWVTPSGSFPTTNKGLRQTAIPTLTNAVTDAQWATLRDAIAAVCYIHFVDPGDILAINNFVYTPTNVNPYGLQTLKDRWEALSGKIALIESGRLNFNPAYVDTSVVNVYNDNTYFSDREYTFGFNYGVDNYALASINGGAQLILTPQITSAIDPGWSAMQTLFTAINSLTINDGNVIRNGTGAGLTGEGIASEGLATVATAPGITLLYQATDPVSGWFIQVRGRKGVSGITILVRLQDTISPYTPGGSPGNLRFSWTAWRPSSAIINTPVLAFPTVSVSFV